MNKNLFRKVICLVIALMMMMPAMPNSLVSADPKDDNIISTDELLNNSVTSPSAITLTTASNVNMHFKNIKDALARLGFSDYVITMTDVNTNSVVFTVTDKDSIWNKVPIGSYKINIMTSNGINVNVVSFKQEGKFIDIIGNVITVTGTADIHFDDVNMSALSLDKSTTTLGYDSDDDVINYNYLITNSGNVTLTAPFTVIDDKHPIFDMSNAPTTLAPGAGFTVSATYYVTQADIDKGSITNTASATGKYETSTVTSNEDSVTVYADKNPNLTIEKSTTAVSYSIVGEEIPYTITVENTGNITLTGVTVSDPMLSDTALVLVSGDTDSDGKLDVGEVWIYSGSYTVKQVDLEAGSIVNTATADSNETLEVEDSVTVTAVDDYEMAIDKTSDTTTYDAAGDVINYTIKVTNPGNRVLSGVTVSDPMLSDTALVLVSGDTDSDGKLDVGEVWIYSGSYTVDQDDLDAGSIVNTATADSNETLEVEDSVTVTAVKNASISIVKKGTLIDTKNIGFADVDEIISYTFTVTNTGNVTLYNIEVTDNHPMVTVLGGPITSLAPGETDSTTFSTSYKITQSDIDLGKVDNTAVVNSLDPQEKNVTSTDIETVLLKKYYYDDDDDDDDEDIPDTNPPLADLEKLDHFAYVIGYPEGDVRPLNNITREEVAMIFYRLLTDESRNNLLSDSNPFIDLENHGWSNRAISTLYNAGIIKGYPDGTFKPSDPISRAEFATIAAKFDKLELGSTSNFTDIFGHWAEKYITSSEIKGWIKGYPDLTFKPEQDITRAEAMTLINNVLERAVPEENIHPDAMFWPDSTSDKWYFEDVMEATNSHNYIYEEDGDELWTGLKANKVWP